MFNQTEKRSRIAALAIPKRLHRHLVLEISRWYGQLYDEQRYLTRNKFSEKKSNETCLSEYAEVFKTVCVDAGYYKFPDERYLEKLISAMPQDFRFSFKVTDVIMLKQFTNPLRFGHLAGQVNSNF